MEKRDDGSGIRCNEHPDAPHGFMRDASHNEGRYVCECEFWEPPKNKPMTRDEWTAWLEESWAEAQARASTPEQKPVAHITGFHNGHCVIQPTDPAVVLPVGTALYRAPTEWVGLDDEEIHQAFCHAEYETNHDWNDDPESWCKAFCRYVEAKLKEKNNVLR